MRETKRFTEAEDEFIKTNISRLGCSAVGRHLGRNPASVVSRATTLGLRKPNRTIRKFTKKEDGFIKRSAGRLSLGEISERLGRTTSSVYGRGLKLGVFFDRKKRTARAKFTSNGYLQIPVEEDGRRRWTLEHVHIVEQRIGRRLKAGEQVHHIDIQPRNNRDDNLHLFSSNAAHSRAHSSLSRLVKQLLECGVICFNAAKGEYELCETSK